MRTISYLAPQLGQLNCTDAGSVSVPFSSPVPIEAPREPKQLAEAGYDLGFRGQLTQIGSAAPKHDRQVRTRSLTPDYGFHMVDVK